MMALAVRPPLCWFVARTTSECGSWGTNHRFSPTLLDQYALFHSRCYKSALLAAFFRASMTRLYLC